MRRPPPRPAPCSPAALLGPDNCTEPKLFPRPCSQDVYIRVIGSIKDFGNRRHLAATQVRAITDHNEIFFHLLESQYVHLVMRRGKPVSPFSICSLATLCPRVCLLTDTFGRRFQRDNSSVALGGGIAGGNAGDYAAGGGGGGGGGQFNDLVPYVQRPDLLSG